MVELLKAFFDVAQPAAVCFGVIIAGLGLKTWHTQLMGTNKYSVAKEVLRAAYKFRDAFSHFRSPVGSIFISSLEDLMDDNKLSKLEAEEWIRKANKVWDTF